MIYEGSSAKKLLGKIVFLEGDDLFLLLDISVSGCDVWNCCINHRSRRSFLQHPNGDIKAAAEHTGREGKEGTSDRDGNLVIGQ